ncbi:hypothetical protein A2311_01330 [candidate division WOR-1 bacterium RIFOXYB2_FULL_48_7]|uniref:SLH domain-containing protein n=1 Tax=candidate division WOR-1 bacterium RIFOXYB2_FULL_48_7 TaxID=1802583 RepID=A0A1F4TI20_UNCSA|nr:MAG: hypothetical protein A2311_01330 [candidate division WOR-1 bacterium RIFOXYB2_FULL_48_7]
MRHKGLIALLLLIVWGLPALAYVAQDPTRYIPNARVLGLGRSFVGLADDVGAIYTNPAGLVEAQGWQISSMSGKFLDEYSYLSFAGLYPTNYGVLGVAYAGTSIAGAFATTIEAGSDPADPIYTIDPSQPLMGNYNNAMVLSYANRVEQLGFLNKLPYANRMGLGISLKLFRAALYGDGIVGGDASGTEIDLGLKVAPQKWLRLGLSAQNILPTSMGGKLRYASGHEESYPASITVGSAFSLLGKENAIWRLGENQLKFLFDVNYQLTLTNYPMVYHAGLEYKPLEMLTLRTGLDQDAAGDGAGNLTTVTDIAYGVGFNLGGFNFDYAYHTFAGAPNIDNHYFSLAYEFIPPAPLAIPKEGIIIDSQSDKVVTFEAAINIVGKVIDPRARKLYINGQPVKFNLQGEFATQVPLRVGKNLLLLEGKDNKDVTVTTKKLRVLRLVTFPDVPLDYWTARGVSLLSMANIISGYPDGTFKPEGRITRAEMCALLMKTLPQTAEVQYTRRKFRDVPTNHWASKYIMQASSLGVVLGYPGNYFKPNGKISRAEGLAMICRLAHIPEEPFTVEFPDMYPDHWASGWVAGAYKNGLLDYLKGRFFEPKRLLNRAETVEMLYKTQYTQDILGKDLLNWDSY